MGLEDWRGGDCAGAEGLGRLLSGKEGARGGDSAGGEGLLWERGLKEVADKLASCTGWMWF